MKKWYRELLEDPKRQKRPIHWYIILTVLGLMGPLYLVGNKSVFWGPVIGAMLSVDLEIRIFGWFSFCVFLAYPIALLAFYLIAIFCRNYLPLTIAAFFDVLYIAMIAAGLIYESGFTGGIVMLMIGVLGNLWFSFYFLSLWKFTKSQGEQPENT